MNSNLKFNNLTVKSFRGINDEISLELKNITILKGENGMGKSSFVNAIEYLFSKELSFLKNKTIPTEAATFNWQSGKNDAKIELKFKKRFIRFENSKRENDPVFDDVLKNPYVNNASFILNRKKLLEFVDGTQGDRYNAVMELCGIKKIDKVQSAISSSNSTISKELDKTSSIYKDKLANLAMSVSENSKLSLDECIELTNKLLIDNGKDTIDNDTDIEEFIRNLDLSDMGVILSKINDFYQLYDKISLSKIKLDDILDEYENIASDNLKTSQSLLKSLKTSFDYIELTNSKQCPVCQSEITPSEILSQLSGKIDAINKSNSKFYEWKSNLNSLIEDLEFEIENCKNLNIIIDDLNKLIGNILPNFEYDMLNILKTDLIEFSNFNKVPGDFKEVKLEILQNEITSIKKLLIDWESSQNVDDLSDIYNILFKIKELKELQAKINVLFKQKEVVSKTFDVFKQTKQNFINEMILEIRDDIKNYYEYIHGDDLISNPDIRLSGPKLIDVYLNSFGKEVDSRSYASEGHIDTLGICIFLAFNKKFNDIPLIVFDDVLTTVDLPHKERIGRLIVDKFEDYQFIITTHSALWSEQLKRLCIDSGRDWKIYEFIDWTLEEGPIISNQLDFEGKINKYLSNEYQDFQAAGNTARRYLEYTLTEICKRNNIKVPINDRYDVGTLFGAVKSFTKNVVKGTSVEPFYMKVWSEINRSRYIANILSHHNEENDLLPKSDVEKFCGDVIELNHAYKCDCGKSFLKLDSDSKKLICSHKKCKDAIDMNSFTNIDFGYVEEEEIKL